MKSPREKAMIWILGVLVLLTAWVYRPRLDIWKRAKGVFSQKVSVKNIQVEVEPLQLAALDAPTPEYDKYERNLFGFGREPVDPDLLARQRAEAERLKEEAVQLQQAARERAEEETREAAAPVKALPHFPMKYMGYVGPLHDRIAIFLDGKVFRAARRGDVLDDRFIIGNVEFDSVEIGHLGYGDVVRIPMEPLN